MFNNICGGSLTIFMNYSLSLRIFTVKSSAGMVSFMGDMVITVAPSENCPSIFM